MIRLVKALVFFTILVLGGAGAALPAEVDFAGLTPSPGGCTTAIGDPGAVCANTQSFSAIGNTFTATGFNNPFDPGGGGALTLSANGLGEESDWPRDCVHKRGLRDRPYLRRWRGRKRQPD